MIQSYKQYYEKSKDVRDLEVSVFEVHSEEDLKKLSDPFVKEFLTIVSCLAEIHALNKRNIRAVDLYQREGKFYAVIEVTPSYLLGHEKYKEMIEAAANDEVPN